MDLRPATPDDLPGIAALHEGNWRRDYVDILPDLALGARLSSDMERRWCQQALDRSQVIVAARDTRLLGFVAMTVTGGDGDGFIENLHVAPAARAQGIGRALMSAMAVLAMPGALSLEVFSRNRAARSIYARWGGQEVETFEEDILGHSVTSIRILWPDAAALAHRLMQGRDV